VWEAENYGQVMYAVKTRTGGVYMELQKRGGDMSCFEADAKSDLYKNERNSGNYGAQTQEKQIKNYVAAKELAGQRVEMFNEALGLYKSKKFDEALVVFENVVGLEPKNYIGDNMQKVTDVYRIAQYNVACCYSMIEQKDAAMDALKAALISGFDDYKMMRGDASLSYVRKDPRFKQLIDRFDEPLLNENAMKVLKGMFGRK
jgi:tetratricopeptide (TPR) repeat protein